MLPVKVTPKSAMPPATTSAMTNDEVLSGD